MFTLHPSMPLLPFSPISYPAPTQQEPDQDVCLFRVKPRASRPAHSVPAVRSRSDHPVSVFRVVWCSSRHCATAASYGGLMTLTNGKAEPHQRPDARGYASSRLTLAVSPPPGEVARLRTRRRGFSIQARSLVSPASPAPPSLPRSPDRRPSPAPPSPA